MDELILTKSHHETVSIMIPYPDAGLIPPARRDLRMGEDSRTRVSALLEDLFPSCSSAGGKRGTRNYPCELNLGPQRSVGSVGLMQDFQC